MVTLLSLAFAYFFFEETLHYRCRYSRCQEVLNYLLNRHLRVCCTFLNALSVPAQYKLVEVSKVFRNR